MTAAAPQRGLSLAQAAGTGVVVWAALLAGLTLLAPGAWKSGFLCGTVTGGLGGAVGFALTMPSLGKPLQAVVASMGLGFLARLILVAAGLLVTIRSLDGEPLGFVFAFFPLFFVFAALELAVVVRHAPAAVPVPAKES